MCSFDVRGTGIYLVYFPVQNKELTPNILEKLFREACPALSEPSLSRDTSSFKVEYVGNPKDAEKILQRTISEFSIFYNISFLLFSGGLFGDWESELMGKRIGNIHVPLTFNSLSLHFIIEICISNLAVNLNIQAGLSMALGAFLAGLLLAETEFLQVESDIAPYRGLLLGLFFMTVGMSIDPKLLVSYYPGDGNVHIWKDYTIRGKQKLVTAFSSIHGHRPGVRSVSAVVDWQQTSGYMDLDKEQLLSSIPLASDCSISALAASQVHGGQYAAGFVDGSVRLYDIRTPDG
ncbi:hypothetical protein CTI12_AA226550 [Artemisia annua]|uniref:Cation/H+ exchanger transmembrane domain-containing protein n=1 Tax=Artemisia annua TaxID=35608 RepID=A0A2U1NUM3_ARTAN|nr:hypothetical protein CTI12_AA226550 [Artemisia annua]